MKDVNQYAEFLVKSICKEPDLVKVSSYKVEDESLIMDILVPLDDMKIVIGKNGKNATSIRTLILAYAYINKLGKIKINFDSF